MKQRKRPMKMAAVMQRSADEDEAEERQGNHAEDKAVVM